MTNNTVRLEQHEQSSEINTSIIEKIFIYAIMIFVLFTYLGWFQWNKSTGLRKIIKAFAQFILCCILALISFSDYDM